MGVSSVPSSSRVCNNSLKSTNSPADAAVANLGGMEGMALLKGASWGRGGKVGSRVADVTGGGTAAGPLTWWGKREGG